MYLLFQYVSLEQEYLCHRPLALLAVLAKACLANEPRDALISTS